MKNTDKTYFSPETTFPEEGTPLFDAVSENRIGWSPDFADDLWLLGRDILEENGFCVTRGLCGIPTAFKATFGDEGYSLGILAEYDALLDDLVISPLSTEPQPHRLTVNVSYYGAQVLASLANEIEALKTCTIVEKPFRQLLEDAENSDGTQLYLVDLYADTYREVKASRTLAFDPIAITQFGIVWQDGSPLAGKESLHRAELKGFPMAVDSHREMLRYADFVYDGYPLDNIQRGVANPRATLAYALTSPQVASTFDSFGFEVACRTSALDMKRLHFTPLATPRAKSWVGFVFSTSNKPKTHERHFIDTLRNNLFTAFPTYYESYPL